MAPMLASSWEWSRGASHRFDATGDVDVSFTSFDRPRRLIDRVQAAGTETIDGHGRYLLGKTGQQRRHTRHIAVVLTSLVGTAEIHFLHFRRVNPRSLNQFAQHQRRQIIRPHGRERAAMPSNGCAYCIYNYNICHFVYPQMGTRITQINADFL